MDTKTNPIEKFINEQVEKWKSIRAAVDKKGAALIPVITVCMEPGSGGSIVAQGIAKRLDLDFFHREILEAISKSAEINPPVLDTLEKERLSGIRDFVSSLVSDKYLHPDVYLEHLKKVVSAIGKRGHAVIVGRGANFILPPEKRFSVRVVAPLEIRVQNIARAYGISEEVAEQRVLKRESRRSDFIRKSFKADIADPINYDFIVNTEKLSIEDAVEAVSVFWSGKYLGA